MLCTHTHTQTHTHTHGTGLIRLAMALVQDALLCIGDDISSSVFEEVAVLEWIKASTLQYLLLE